MVRIGEVSRNSAATPTFPDIDAALLVLTGIGSAAYIGTKLVPSTSPFIVSVSSDTVARGGSVTIDGANFGATGRIELGGVELQSGAQSWRDTQVVLLVPQAKPDGTAWSLNQPLTLRVLGPSGASVNSATLRLT